MHATTSLSGSVEKRTRAFISWSSGKDSAFALLEAQQVKLLDVVGAITTIDEVDHRVAAHGVRETLVDRQIDRLGVPCLKIRVPQPCPNAVHEARLGDALATLGPQGIQHVVFGDLHLADIRVYREQVLGALGLVPVFPLWGRDTAALARKIIETGIQAYVVCVDTRRLAPSFAGRCYDGAFLNDLPAGVDPCGEHGEFHTVVTAGPMFRDPISVVVGDRTEHAGFAFADVIPT